MPAGSPPRGGQPRHVCKATNLLVARTPIAGLSALGALYPWGVAPSHFIALVVHDSRQEEQACTALDFLPVEPLSISTARNLLLMRPVPGAWTLRM